MVTPELKKRSAEHLIIAKKFTSIYSSATSRKIEFAMTLKEVGRLINETHCFFTGVKLNKKENDPHQITFDRLDNDQGYIDGNVVACSKEFNEIKGNLTLPQIKTMVEAFKKKKLW